MYVSEYDANVEEEQGEKREERKDEKWERWLGAIQREIIVISEGSETRLLLVSIVSTKRKDREEFKCEERDEGSE